MNRAFSAVAPYAGHQAGRPLTFLLATLVVVVWGITGPLFNFSDTWQLVIYRNNDRYVSHGVHHSEHPHRDGAAIQAKLDELVRTSAAQNRFIGIEHFTDEEIEAYRVSCADLAKKASDRASKRAQASAASAAEQAVT